MNIEELIKILDNKLEVNDTKKVTTKKEEEINSKRK